MPNPDDLNLCMYGNYKDFVRTETHGIEQSCGVSGNN